MNLYNLGSLLTPWQRSIRKKKIIEIFCILLFHFINTNTKQLKVEIIIIYQNGREFQYLSNTVGAMVHYGEYFVLFCPLIAPLSDITMFNIKYIYRNAQSAHACWCNKAVIVWLCVCTRDNSLAKARGLSSRTYAQTIQ